MDSNFFGLNHIVFAADKPFQHTEAPNPALPGSEIILGTKLTYKVMRKPYILKSDMLFKPVYIYEYINIYIYTSSLFFSFNGTHTHTSIMKQFLGVPIQITSLLIVIFCVCPE